MWSKLTRLFATPLLLLGAAVVLAQTPENAPPTAQESATTAHPSQPAVKAQFFAGSVTDVDHDHVTVSRTLVGKPPESRTFLIKPETKVSKTLRLKARVTVRYKSFPEGDVALEIRIHSQPRAPKTP